MKNQETGMPMLTKKSVIAVIVYTTIPVIGSIIVTTWQHHCTRKTMKLQQKLWKERYTMSKEEDEEPEEE